jgi:hypothetical protein
MNWKRLSIRMAVSDGSPGVSRGRASGRGTPGPAPSRLGRDQPFDTSRREFPMPPPVPAIALRMSVSAWMFRKW